MNPFFIWIFLFFISFETFAAPSRVKRVPVLPDQIVTVKTALGIATIIQVPDRPNSLVVGDNEAFKVDMLYEPYFNAVLPFCTFSLTCRNSS